MAGPNQSWMTVAARYSGLALAIPAGVVAGYGIGYLLDKRLGTHWIYIVGVILGAVGGMGQIVRQLMRDSNDGGG